MVVYKRGSGKYNSEYLSKDYYQWYVTNVSDPLPYSLFKAIFKEYIQAMMVEVIYHGYELVLPGKLGSIYIREIPYVVRLKEDGTVDKRNLIPDWSKTLKKWEILYPGKTPAEVKAIEGKPIIYHNNEHSEETVKQWYWNKISCNFKYQSIYKFNATRTWDRLLAKANKDKNITYYGL